MAIFERECLAKTLKAVPDDHVQLSSVPRVRSAMSTDKPRNSPTLNIVTSASWKENLSRSFITTVDEEYWPALSQNGG